MRVFLLLIICAVSQTIWADSNENSRLKPSEMNISFLLLGQSNMAGQGKVSELSKPMKKLPNNIQFYLNGSLADIRKQQKFGPEVTFAHRVAAKYPRKKINIIKFAPGGSLMKDWLSHGHHYQTLKKQLKKISQSTNINLKGVLWMQGESDTKSLKLAKNYKQELILFIKTLRIHFKKQKLAFVIGKISIPESYRPAVKEIKAAQDAVCKQLSFVDIIPTKSLEKNKDKVHYSTRGQLVLGRLFAQKLLGTKIQ